MNKTYIKYCKSCGNQIPEARVKILPHTPFCVPCAETKVTKKLAVTKLDGDIEHGATVIDIVESDEYGQQITFNPKLLEVEPEFNSFDKRPINIPSRKEYLE
jgi:hypothetical protein